MKSSRAGVIQDSGKEEERRLEPPPASSGSATKRIPKQAQDVNTDKTRHNLPSWTETTPELATNLRDVFAVPREGPLIESAY